MRLLMLPRVAVWPCFIVLLISAHAQEANLPSYTILGCGKNCGTRTAPMRINQETVDYPAREAHAFPQYESEAYVLIRFTVEADGTVQDTVIERLVGPKDFAENSLSALKTWHYQPATVDGKPVVRPNWMVQFFYRFTPPVYGARDHVYSTYKSAQALFKDKKPNEAITVLLPLLSLERLNFYERTMVSYLLADCYMNVKDYLTAREYIEDATLGNGTYLDKHAQESAARLRIRLDAATGQFGDALDWFEKLKKMTDVDADDEDAKLIERVRARLTSPDPIAVSGAIPATGYSVLWHHTLLKRNFAFPQIEGKLDRFELRCDQQQISSPITATAEWHVPQDWSNCTLNVFGEPGAKFTVVES